MKAKIAHMYTKVLGVALLELTFHLPVSLLPRHASSTPRLTQLCVFIDQNFNKSALFDDIRPFVEELSFSEASCLVLEMLPDMAKDVRCYLFYDGLRLEISASDFVPRSPRQSACALTCSGSSFDTCLAPAPRPWPTCLRS